MSKQLELDYIQVHISKFEATILPCISKFQNNLPQFLLGIFKIVRCACFIQIKLVRSILLSSTVYTNFSNNKILNFHGYYIIEDVFLSRIWFKVLWNWINRTIESNAEIFNQKVYYFQGLPVGIFGIISRVCSKQFDLARPIFLISNASLDLSPSPLHLHYNNIW